MARTEADICSATLAESFHGIFLVLEVEHDGGPGEIGRLCMMRFHRGAGFYMTAWQEVLKCQLSSNRHNSRPSQELAGLRSSE